MVWLTGISVKVLTAKKNNGILNVYRRYRISENKNVKSF